MFGLFFFFFPFFFFFSEIMSVSLVCRFAFFHRFASPGISMQLYVCGLIKYDVISVCISQSLFISDSKTDNHIHQYWSPSQARFLNTCVSQSILWSPASQWFVHTTCQSCQTGMLHASVEAYIRKVVTLV